MHTFSIYYLDALTTLRRCLLRRSSVKAQTLVQRNRAVTPRNQLLGRVSADSKASNILPFRTVYLHGKNACRGWWFFGVLCVGSLLIASSSAAGSSDGGRCASTDLVGSTGIPGIRLYFRVLYRYHKILNRERIVFHAAIKHGPTACNGSSPDTQSIRCLPVIINPHRCSNKTLFPNRSNIFPEKSSRLIAEELSACC